MQRLCPRMHANPQRGDQGRQGRPHTHRPIQPIARHDRLQLRDIHRLQPGLCGQLRHQVGQKDLSGPAIQPVPARPVFAIRPDIAAAGKGRPGSRIPAPGMHQFDRHHRLAIDRGDRILRRVRPMGQQGFQDAPLDQVIAGSVGEMRPATLRALGIDEEIGLVGALVDRRTPDLGEPDRLALWHPARRVSRPHTRDPLMMRLAPEGAHILHPPDPGLVIGPVRDRGADLGRPVGLTGIIPVIPFPALDRGGEIVRIPR